MEGCLALLLPGSAFEVTHARWLAQCFPERAWLAVELLYQTNDLFRLEQLSCLGRQAGLPLVAAGDVHMHARSRRALQDTLTAIRLGCTVVEAEPTLYANGERHLRKREVLAAVYPRELLAETLNIAAQCHFSLASLRYEYPEELVPPRHTPTSHLRRLTEEGLQKRWPAGAQPKVRAAVEHELALIQELAYEPYFLTVHDLVQFARSRGILCQGRGSAANSAVCYCLGITEVDPARMEMLFERFISRERNEPPDIDVDFEHERREEVIQYIYQKYGRERAALAATVITYRPRSAIRDVGKALGLEAHQVDRLAKSVFWWDGRKVRTESLEELGFDPASLLMQRLVSLVNTLIGFPRHLSQHVGGFVITRGQLSRLVPIENAAMTERTVIQWDKDDLEALGFLKVDVLGLGMLTAIHRCFDLIAEHRGRRLTMAAIPAEDPRVYAMIQRADTMGVFQIESRAQMAMLPRLKPERFYDLVIEVAIVRPGPIQGGMVHPYLRRRQGKEPVTYPSEAVREVLARTLGVAIFQEQVMRLAVVAAGFSPGEADQLRRAMAAWRRKGGLAAFEQRLREGMRARGYAQAFAEQLFRQIQGFGEYGFPESHAASFALLVYVSAWLKCYEPAAFTCALLNSQPMGFYAPAQLVQDVRRHGVEVRPVDVRDSQWDCSLELDDAGEPALRLGLRMVNGLSRSGARRLVTARGSVPYRDVNDLVARAKLAHGDVEKLAAAGALSGIAGHRHQARWEVAGIEALPPLIEGVSFNESEPVLPQPTEFEDMLADYRMLGLSLGRHPLAWIRRCLDPMRLSTAASLRAREHGDPVRVAGLVISRQCPATASGVLFMTLEDETGFINVVVWPWVMVHNRRVVLTGQLLEVTGAIEREGEVIHVVAGGFTDQSRLLGHLALPSRDFC